MGLFNFLEKTGCYKNKDFYIITRCPFCGDSKRRRYNHGHLYIYKDTWMFKCFRCGKFGPLKKVLIEYLKDGIIDDPSKIEKIINKLKLSEKHVNYLDTSSRIYFPKQEVFPGKKILYISDRMNISESEIDFERYKIIFDIEKFFEYNKHIVNKYNLSGKNIDKLNKHYVGFVTKYSTKVVFRSIDDNVEPRYIQYSVKDNILSSIDHYSIYSDFDIFNSKELIIAEGIFDITNKLINNYFSENIPRIALLGKTRILSLHKIIKYVYMEKVPHIIYFIDADLLNEVYHIKTILERCAYKVSIYKNYYGKDFGCKKIYPEKIT